MIECPKCHLEYRGSIPNYCMDCGTELPKRDEYTRRSFPDMSLEEQDDFWKDSEEEDYDNSPLICKDK